MLNLNRLDMKKGILVCIALVMALGLGACSSDDESNQVDEYSELPAWLVPQAKALEAQYKDWSGDPSLYYSIRRATGIHGETVYHIYRAFDSCLLCDLYDENGNSVDYIDVFGERQYVGDEGWVVIFPKK